MRVSRCGHAGRREKERSLEVVTGAGQACGVRVAARRPVSSSARLCMAQKGGGGGGGGERFRVSDLLLLKMRRSSSGENYKILMLGRRRRRQNDQTYATVHLQEDATCTHVRVYGVVIDT